MKNLKKRVNAFLETLTCWEPNIALPGNYKIVKLDQLSGWLNDLSIIGALIWIIGGWHMAWLANHILIPPKDDNSSNMLSRIYVNHVICHHIKPWFSDSQITKGTKTGQHIFIGINYILKKKNIIILDQKNNNFWYFDWTLKQIPC